MSFAIYLDSLVGSWRALAAPHPEAAVIEGDGYVAARFPEHPMLDNALLLEPAALDQVCAHYRDASEFAIWTCADATAAAMGDAGFVRIEVTAAMVCLLPAVDVDVDVDVVPVEVGEVDPVVVADLNSVPDDLLAGVPGARAYATADRTSGALLIRQGSDVNVGFVATRRHRRRRGLASAVLTYALAEATRDGARTASLQATALGTGVYRRLGFRQVGLWQEWAPG